MSESRPVPSGSSASSGSSGSSSSGRSSGTPSGQRTSPATYYRQVVAELRKVVWPTQQQLVTYFIVVLVFVAVVMTIVSLLDIGFGKLVFEIFGGEADPAGSS